MVKLTLLCFAALMGVVICKTELRLWTAAAEGDITHVDEYLTKGTSPLWQNRHWPQDSALHIASRNNHTEVVKRLLDEGVDVNLTNGLNQTALHIASEKGHKAVTTLLLANDGNVNLGDEDGRTPLHLASLSGHTDTATILLANGADPGITDKYGDTAGDDARHMGHIELGNIIDSYTSTTIRASPPTPAPNAKHTPRPIRLLRLMQLLHPTG